MQKWVAAFALVACIGGCEERVEQAPNRLANSWGPSLQRAELPDDVQASIGDLEAVVGTVTTSTVGNFLLEEDTVFCVFKNGWTPSSDNLLRDFDRPYETTEGIKSYQLISDLTDCPTPGKAIFIAVVVRPSATPRENEASGYQLWFAAWQGAGMGGNNVFSATVTRDEPRDDAIGILDTIGSSAPEATDLALRMSQSLGKDGMDIMKLLASQVRAERD